MSLISSNVNYHGLRMQCIKGLVEPLGTLMLWECLTLCCNDSCVKFPSEDWEIADSTLQFW